MCRWRPGARGPEVRRLIAAAALAVTVGACSQGTNFHKEGEVCYRNRTHSFLGLQYGESEVQAIPQNCEAS